MATVSTPNSVSSDTSATAQAPRRTVHAGEPIGLDAQLLLDTKHEINAIVQEIAQLANQDISTDEFYSGFLGRIVAAMAAVGGAVWTLGENGRIALQHQVNFNQSGIDSSPQSRTRHGQLLKSIVDRAQPTLALPSSGATKESAPANPTDLLLILAPLVVERHPLAIVEIFQRPGITPGVQRGYLRFLVQMAEIAIGFLKTHRLRQLEEHQARWRQLESLISSLHRSLDLRETAYAIVNEGRRMIGCDRVSLALRCGGSCRIEAVSGLDAIDRRAAEIQGLAKLAEAILLTGEPLWSEGGEEELPEQIQRPLQAYSDRSHARMVAVLPLTAMATEEHGPTQEQGTALPARSAQAIGALIVEQLRDSQASETLRSRAAIVAQHSGAALANSIEHSCLFLLPIWKFLGRMTWMLRGRALPKTLLVLGMMLGGIYALATVQTDFAVAARGKLQPAQRREVFAPLDGLVARVPVEHGQVIDRGAVLAELTNTDLDLQLAELLGRQTTIQERLTSLARTLLDNKGGAARLTPADENRLTGEMLQLQQQADNVQRELVLVRDKQRQLTVVAPQRGQVVTWKVRDLLLQRPVSRGQELLTLADPDGPWELELYLPERRLSHLQRAQIGSGEPAQSLNVTFVLSSHPATTFRGRVVEIEQSAEVRGDEGNTVLVRVTLDREQLPPLHDQTTVTAKIHCGRTSLGYAWFCDLIETAQSKVLFWLP